MITNGDSSGGSGGGGGGNSTESGSKERTPNGSASTGGQSSARPVSSGASSGGDGNKENSGGGSKHKTGCQKSVATTVKVKDETTRKLEADAKRLRSELQLLRSAEADLRSQMTRRAADERASRAELEQVKNEYEILRSKLESISERVEADRNSLQVAENRLSDERKQRVAMEHELAELRKLKPSAEEENGTAGLAKLNGKGRGTSAEFTCASRIKAMEKELRGLQKEIASRDSQIVALKAASTASMSSNTDSYSHVALGSAVGSAITPAACEHLQQKRTEFEIQELTNQLAQLKKENERLGLNLQDKEKQKKELTQAYYASLKEVTDLSYVLTKREYEIVELNMKLDHMAPQMLSYIKMYNSSGPTGAGQEIPCSGLINGAGGAGTGSMSNGLGGLDQYYPGDMGLFQLPTTSACDPLAPGQPMNNGISNGSMGRQSSFGSLNRAASPVSSGSMLFGNGRSRMTGYPDFMHPSENAGVYSGMRSPSPSLYMMQNTASTSSHNFFQAKPTQQSQRQQFSQLKDMFGGQKSRQRFDSSDLQETAGDLFDLDAVGHADTSGHSQSNGAATTVEGMLECVLGGHDEHEVDPALTIFAEQTPTSEALCSSNSSNSMKASPQGNDF